LFRDLKSPKQRADNVNSSAGFTH